VRGRRLTTWDMARPFLRLPSFPEVSYDRPCVLSYILHSQLI
jgi:hypothetical protein